jgi:hypothetical protein
MRLVLLAGFYKTQFPFGNYTQRRLHVAGCDELQNSAPLTGHHRLAESNESELNLSIGKAGVQLGRHACALEREAQDTTGRRIPHHSFFTSGYAELAAVQRNAAGRDHALLLICEHCEVLGKHSLVPASVRDAPHSGSTGRKRQYLSLRSSSYVPPGFDGSNAFGSTAPVHARARREGERIRLRTRPIS